MRRIRLGSLAGAALLGGAMLLAQPAISRQATTGPGVATLTGAFLAGFVAERDNDLPSAVTYFKRALALDPDNPALQQSLLIDLIALGRFDEALPYAEKLKTTPDSERFSRLALAVDAFRKNDHAGAETWLKLALESDFDRLASQLMTAWAKLGAGDGKGALALLDTLDGPDWYAVFVDFHRGLIAERAGLAGEAEKAFSELVGNPAMAGGAPDTYLRAAEAYAGFLARKGEKDKALEIVDNAAKLAPGRLPLEALARKIKAGEPVEPLVAGPRAGAAEVLFDLAMALNRTGGESFVRLYLHYALALEPESDVVLMQLAAVSEQLSQPEDAIGFYRRVPSASVLKHIADLQEGLNLADLGKQDEAVARLKASLASDPDDPRAYLALGGVYSVKEDYRSAAEVYDQAVARLGADTPAGKAARQNGLWNLYYQRGIAYERLKEWPKAEPNFHEALKLQPDQPQVLNYLGYSWVDMDMNLQEGLRMIQKAVDLRPNDGYIVDSLGWAYYRLGRYDDAVREMERAVSLRPDDPVLNDHLGDVYWRVGRRLEATFQWTHARDLKPDPDLLAAVEKKLAEGLPPIEDKTAAKAGAPAPAVPPAPPPGPERRSEIQPGGDATAATQAEPASYVVKAGQSLWSIATDVLGDGARYHEILQLNPELSNDPGRIRPGQQLRLP